MFLLACQITDDIVDPVPTPALLIISVVSLLLAGTLSALLIVASRSARAREQYRIAAALASEHLPADLDFSIWEPALRKRSDRSRRTPYLLLAPLLGAFGAVELNRTSTSIYGTLLWTTYLAVMLLVVLASLSTFTRTRSVAQQLLVRLNERTHSAGTH